MNIEGTLNSIMFRISILPYSIIQLTIREEGQASDILLRAFLNVSSRPSIEQARTFSDVCSMFVRCCPINNRTIVGEMTAKERRKTGADWKMLCGNGLSL